MARVKRAHLNQHLKYVKHGEPRVRTKDLEISLDENEITYCICRRHGATEPQENFQLLSEEGQDMDTLAILRQYPACVNIVIARLRPFF
jgi:hypothetical protein